MAESLNTPLLEGSEDLSPLVLLLSPPRMRRCRHEAIATAGISCTGSIAENNASDGLFHAAAAAAEHAQSRDDHSSSSFWFNNPQLVSAMISNFSTSYNVVNISLVLPILKACLQLATTTEPSLEYSSAAAAVAVDSQQQQEDAVAAVASSLLAGMMVGQVLGGALGDLVGAERALRLVMLLQIGASLGSATTATTTSSSVTSVYWHLSAWRFVLGVGAGGVYPLAAVLSASQQQQQQQLDERDEAKGIRHANSKNGASQSRSDDANGGDRDDDDSSLHRVVLTFSTQGLGFIAVPLVTVMLLYTVSNLDAVWRIVLGLGSVPGIVLLLWQLWLSSSSRSCCRSARQHEVVPMQEEDAAVVFESSSSETLAKAVFDVAEGQHRDGTDGDGGNDGVSDYENESILDSIPDDKNGASSQWEDNDGASTTPQSDHVPATEHRSWWNAIRHEENLAQKLLGTAATWFLFDVLFYGNTLFQPIVIEAAFGAREHTNPLHLLQRTAIDSLVLTSIALPGYAVAGLVLGKKTMWCYCGIEQTPRFVMLQGFTAMAVLYLVIGAAWNELRRFPPLLVLLYSMTFFFANYGPNTTTFVLPSLVYSPECRSTFNGLSAAAGKLGALMGASLFEPAADLLGDASVMLLCSAIAVMALVMTKWFVPKSLSHNSNVVQHHHIPIASDSLSRGSHTIV